MLQSVEVENFLSHSHTKLTFGSGITVFVGPNGAGKSSIIDAITFALFGEHIRKSAKGLLRRGSSQAYSRVEFSIGSRQFEAVRKIDARGTVSAQLYEKVDGAQVPRASGERRQFGESMTREIESMVGLDFEKLKVASIVQQGELQAIIDADPKKFKELINAIVGIDRLDAAYESMKKTMDTFRSAVRTRLGHDDMDIAALRARLESLRKDIATLEPRTKAMEEEKKLRDVEFLALQKKIESEAPKEFKILEMEKKKDELSKYIRTAVMSIKAKIAEKERKVSECSECLSEISAKGQVEHESLDLQNRLEAIKAELLETRNKVSKMRGQEEIAERLQMVDGKCPVCNSKVSKINPLFDQAHLRTEISVLSRRAEELAKEEVDVQARKGRAVLKLQQIIKSEGILASSGIRSQEDLSRLRAEVVNLQASIKEQQADGMTSGGMMQVAIDDFSTDMIRAIDVLAEETHGFDAIQFKNLKAELEKMRITISDLDRELGSSAAKLEMCRTDVGKTSSVLDELEHVRQYMSLLESMRGKVYNRDGPVATSLRSWALGMISQKASEYLSTFNVKIQRISLEDKARDIGITCFSGNSVLELESLSGGEKVSVALALRMGMAHLMGSSQLNFIILDEPTTHLDHERRRSLVSVLSQAFESKTDAAAQFIIITHDSEIFENTNIDTIYEFRATPEGTQVVSL